jgi:hypothetical protein
MSHLRRHDFLRALGLLPALRASGMGFLGGETRAQDPLKVFKLGIIGDVTGFGTR